MIKYLHKLSQSEIAALLESVVDEETYNKFIEDYPRPKWCSCKDATKGIFACQSLIHGYVKSEWYCEDCDCYNSKIKVFNCYIPITRKLFLFLIGCLVGQVSVLSGMIILLAQKGAS